MQGVILSSAVSSRHYPPRVRRFARQSQPTDFVQSIRITEVYCRLGTKPFGLTPPGISSATQDQVEVKFVFTRDSAVADGQRDDTRVTVDVL